MLPRKRDEKARHRLGVIALQHASGRILQYRLRDKGMRRPTILLTARTDVATIDGTRIRIKNKESGKHLQVSHARSHVAR